ncbi:MAG: M6 family metalloprotease domain-containing protein, partial [Gemmatimonadetes bacterium]|nr:M6 family metalloprotease domain-containing protein [Gemmatimonadota bacterium]
SLTADQVAGGVSGLGGSSRVGQFVVELLVPLSSSVDWGRFDNDGPDGVPNSGDDDGYVDVLAVMHPTHGAECGDPGIYDRVWSHRWSLSGALGQVFDTGTPSASGGFIKIDDYTIQPVLACSPTGAINQIGVFAHELGHGFGLPDLYATGDSGHAGIGRWGLMGTGSWGCGAFDPDRPCHMSAWSKAALGWVDVETLPREADLGTVALDPVVTSGRVLMVDAGDGSGEYFLLENRQRQGYDASLPEPGLLVWHIDPDQVGRRWPVNAVNSDPRHMGVWLRQADGRDDLGRVGGNRGDTGDPFPGSGGAAAFHAGSSPRSFSHRGTATGVTLMDISRSGEQVRLRVLTRYQTLRLGGVGPLSAFVVDGDTLAPGDQALSTAPFQVREVSAPAGALVRDGVRRGFTGWSDDASAGRARTWTTGLEDAALSAVFDGGEEVRLRVRVEGDTAGVSPGAVGANPATDDGWYAPGVEVALHAEPRAGFSFLGWEGDLTGSPNPALVALAGPVDATARFQQRFGVEGDATVPVRAAAEMEIVFQAGEGTPPYAWSLVEGALPEGMAMTAGGVVRGAALETGSFPLVVQAVDAIGLIARAAVALEVSAPVLGVGALTDPFFLRPSTLTGTERLFLDRVGNRNGTYDLGDFRSFVLDNPGLPMTAAERTQLRLLVPLVDFRREGGP